MEQKIGFKLNLVRFLTSFTHRYTVISMNEFGECVHRNNDF